MRFPRLRTSVREILAVIAIVAALFWFVHSSIHAYDEARRSARGAWCSNNLKEIGLALHNYHEAYGCFPPAYVSDPAGRPMHSWRVLILPFIDETKLYNAYNFAEPWDGPNNSKLAGSRPGPYTCPNAHNYGDRSARTSYLAIAGPGTAFPGSGSTKLSDVLDGTDETIMVGEVADTGFNWMEPRDLDVRAMSLVIDDRSRPSISSPDPKGPYVLCADGRVRVLPRSIVPGTMKSLTTISGGERLPDDWDQ